MGTDKALLDATPGRALFSGALHIDLCEKNCTIEESLWKMKISHGKVIPFFRSKGGKICEGFFLCTRRRIEQPLVGCD